ncbi:hypothetical protein [Streptomyces sp. LUP47B]|uniref:hypothetical protein n=1 Tax=Streptomyces sp. LUP47B TaxID=1890286 RepID=UPI000851F25B|nr:hypothetical protein [Streptomyces sp. LUP47B]
MTSPALGLRPGAQLASTVCGTRVVVVKAQADARPRLTCGGEPMVPAAEAAAAATAAPATQNAGTLIGKRYVDAAGSLELLCTAAGRGPLACDGTVMEIKAAKPLPASD